MACIEANNADVIEAHRKKASPGIEQAIVVTVNRHISDINPGVTI